MPGGLLKDVLGTGLKNWVQYEFVTKTQIRISGIREMSCAEVRTALVW